MRMRPIDRERSCYVNNKMGGQIVRQIGSKKLVAIQLVQFYMILLWQEKVAVRLEAGSDECH